jgi:Xaa-Pro aminopeptidase
VWVGQVTNEPGYYEDGAFGIRIESVLVVGPAPRPVGFGGTPFLAFETITAVPLQRTLLDPGLLTAGERAWIDAYHGWCRAAVAPLLPPDSPAAAWLHRHTEPLKL